MSIPVEKKQNNKKYYFWLWLFAILGTWCVIPYIYYLGLIPTNISILTVFLFSSLQAAVIYGAVCWLSFKIIPKTDLHPFPLKNFLKKALLPGICLGILVGLLLYFLSALFFQNSAFSNLRPPIWAGLLASVYGAVNEEVLLRLCLFSLVYLFFQKIFQFKADSRVYFLWITNIIIALLFGIGHLPAVFKLITPSNFEIFRVLFLNAIPSLLFGWLYWSKGISSSIVAHFSADLMIHVFLA